MSSFDISELLTFQSDQTFLIDHNTGQKTSFTEHFQRAFAIALWLQEAGCKQADNVAIMLENSSLFAEIYFACLYSGITIVPVNPQWPVSQVKFLLEQTEPKLVVINQTSHTKFTELFKELEIDCVLPPNEEIPGTQQLIIKNTKPPIFKPTIDANNIAIIIYTSGSTSVPKGVAHTIGNLVGNGLSFIEALGIDESYRFLNYLPMNYNAGLFNLLLIPYLARASVVISQVFSPALIPSFWKIIAAYEINSMWFVPTIMSILLLTDRDKAGAQQCISKMKQCFVGTAPLRRELKKRFEERYQLKLHESYGITETLLICSDSYRFPVKENSVGKLLPNVEVKIIDHEADILPVNQIGEIAIKTPYFMAGYFKSKEANYLDKQNYFLSGDVGYLTENNEIVLVDRKKDLIIRGGINVSPISIETVLYQHSSVEMCAAVGLPDELSGEEIVAVIKPRDDIQLASFENELKILCKSHLSDAEQPKYYLTLEEFPLTATGKVQKAKVRDLVKRTFNVQLGVV